MLVTLAAAVGEYAMMHLAAFIKASHIDPETIKDGMWTEAPIERVHQRLDFSEETADEITLGSSTSSYHAVHEGNTTM
jgi:hypothetical protein